MRIRGQRQQEFKILKVKKQCSRSMQTILGTKRTWLSMNNHTRGPNARGRILRGTSSDHRKHGSQYSVFTPILCTSQSPMLRKPSSYLYNLHTWLLYSRFFCLEWMKPENCSTCSVLICVIEHFPVFTHKWIMHFQPAQTVHQELALTTLSIFTPELARLVVCLAGQE